MLKGERVSLRPLRKADVHLFVRWFNDPEIVQFLKPFWSVTELMKEKWIEEMSNIKENCVFVIEHQFSRESSIGICGLHQIRWKDQDATFGIVIGNKKEWKKGLGKESSNILLKYGFHTLNLHRISSSAKSFNERSIKMHKNLGFKEEGICRKKYFVNGEFHDEIMFGLLKEEWEKKKNKESSIF